MSDQLGPWDTGAGTAVRVPPLCTACRGEVVVRELSYKPGDPWRSAELIYLLLLFQRATARPDVQANTKPPTGDKATDARNLEQAVGRYCLRCLYPGDARKVVVVMRKGLEHAAAVSQAKIHDDDHIDFRSRKEQS